MGGMDAGMQDATAAAGTDQPNRETLNKMHRMNECIEQVENIENKIINYSIRIHECTEIILYVILNKNLFVLLYGIL